MLVIAYLRVGNARFMGEWSALRNIIQPSSIIRPGPGDFYVDVRHIKIRGIPNKFAPVSFIHQKQPFLVIDRRNKLPDKTIHRFTTKEGTDFGADHFKVLAIALVEHGCCRECVNASESHGMFKF